MKTLEIIAGILAGAAAFAFILYIDDLERELESAPAPTSDLENTSRPGADSQLSDPFDMICSTLASIPGSGYEFLKR